jgi:hypothetical protein
MIEPIIFFALGFLAASLFVLMAVPFVHERAVRHTTRRICNSAPASNAETRVEKDLLRAEFAMSMRRLEMRIEQLNAKLADQFAELGKNSTEINQLKIELGKRTAELFFLEGQMDSTPSRRPVLLPH